MSHQRTTIRNALHALLLGTAPTYATAAEDRVFKNYVQTLDDLPAIIIRDGDETAKPRDIRSAMSVRELEFKIEVTVENNDGYDEELDDIALEIETLINGNSKLSGTANGCVYNGCTPVYDENGQKIIGKLSMNYIIQYIF